MLNDAVIDLIRHTAIRGRVALALTCIERVMERSEVRDERIGELVNALWGFVEGNLAEADDAWREVPAADLLDAVEGREGILEHYPDLPAFLPRLLYDAVDLATGEMYGAVKGYAEGSLASALAVLRLCEQNHIPVPPVEVFARMPFIVGGPESNQWGPHVPRSFFADATPSPDGSETTGYREVPG